LQAKAVQYREVEQFRNSRRSHEQWKKALKFWVRDEQENSWQNAEVDAPIIVLAAAVFVHYAFTCFDGVFANESLSLTTSGE